MHPALILVLGTVVGTPSRTLTGLLITRHRWMIWQKRSCRQACAGAFTCIRISCKIKIQECRTTLVASQDHPVAYPL